jgi:hypothetical protein
MVRTFTNVTMFPQYNNNIILKRKNILKTKRKAGNLPLEPQKKKVRKDSGMSSLF